MIYFGLLLFFVFEYIRPATFVPALGAAHLNTAIPLLVVSATLLSRRDAAGTPPWRRLQFWLLAALLGLIGLSILTADVTLYAYQVFIMVVGYVLIAWVIARQVQSRSRLLGLMAVLVLVHVGVAALTPEMITNPETRHYLASGSFLGDGNDFALSLNIVVPFCLFFATTNASRWARVLALAVFFFLVFCIVATQSRGGTVGLAAVGVYYWVKSDKKIVIGAVVALVAALVLLYAPQSYFERMNKINTSEGSARGRILAWEASVRMARDHPVLGVGAGHFGVKYGVDYRPPTGEQVPWQTAHSIYFLTLGELGIPGLFVIVGLIAVNLRSNQRLARRLARRSGLAPTRDRRLLTSLSASLIGFAVNGAFLSATYYPHIYVLTGLFVAAAGILEGRPGTPDDEAAPPAGAGGGML